MKYYDVNQDGTISLGEFIHGLREPFNGRRLNIVKKAFAALDKNNAGKIAISEVSATYDVHTHPRFINGSYTRDQLLAEFLLNFESAKTGFIVEKEFFEYYQDLSMTYTHDEAFVHLLENSWCLSEDEGAGVFKQQVDFITSALRLKLRTMANQSSEEFTLRNIFKDLDLDQSGSLTVNEFASIFHKLAISCERKYISALFKKFDTNCNGLIEFDEFANWMIYNAYK
jgi:Ca2+-binding EF-hand superfamily protein